MLKRKIASIVLASVMVTCLVLPLMDIATGQSAYDKGREAVISSMTHKPNLSNIRIPQGLA